MEKVKKISDLFCELFISSDFNKVKVNEIFYLFKTLTKKEFIYLSVEIKNSINRKLSYSYDFILDKKLLYSLDEEKQVMLLGMCTFHPNGYVRERYFNYLLNYNIEMIFPFILLRCADYVNEIGYKGTKYLLNILTLQNIKIIIENMFIIEKQKYLIRFHYESIIEKIESIYKENDLTNLLEKYLTKKDEFLREYALLKLISFKNITLENKVKYILGEKILPIRAKGFQNLITNLEEKDIIYLKDFFIKDKSSKIRKLMLNELLRINYYNKPSDLMEFAIDSNISIRGDGRYYMKKFGFNDFIAFYIDKVKNNYTDGALYGLCEVAGKKEFEILKQYSTGYKRKIEKKILKTLALLDFNNSINIILKYLQDEKAGYSKIAKGILIEHKGEFNEEKVYKILKSSTIEHVKINSAYILINLNKWISIKYIIEFISYKDKKLKEIAYEGLTSWIYNFNTNQTKPSEKEKEEINKSIKKYGAYLQEEILKQLIFLIPK